MSRRRICLFVSSLSVTPPHIDTATTTNQQRHTQQKQHDEQTQTQKKETTEEEERKRRGRTERDEEKRSGTASDSLPSDNSHSSVVVISSITAEKSTFLSFSPQCRLSALCVRISDSHRSRLVEWSQLTVKNRRQHTQTAISFSRNQSIRCCSFINRCSSPAACESALIPVRPLSHFD